MRSPGNRLRVCAWLASSSLCLTTVSPVVAQPAPPPGAEQAGDQGTDPPALAGRLAEITGSVSFHNAGETQWNAATLNYPVTSGEAFWTEPQAGATLEIADNRLVMDDSTEVDITTLDQTQLLATEAQGAIFLQLNSLPTGQGVSFNTPRGTVQISAVGRYEIVAGDTNDATSVTVVEGAAHVSGNNLSLDIGPQQTATIGGTDVLQGSVGAMQQDAFLQAQLAVRATAAALPPQVRGMTGAADLPRYGSFTQTAQYGQVWYPSSVPSNWAPYRDGHWAYVQPWGWTWVDNARWGFAPFHYGRWVQVNDRWGWVTGGDQAYGGDQVYGGDQGYGAYPVYSPALVSFVDVGGAALAGAAIGFAAGELVGGYAPAWIPLGPREPYYPWYHVRPNYFARINGRYGVPRDVIMRGPTYINNVTINNRTNNFINRGGATVIPAAAFARGQSVMRVGRPLPERALAEARPVVGRLPVRPTAFTPNLPPAAARRFDVTLPRTPVSPVTAGPRIMAAEPGRRAAPALRPAALPGNVHATPAAQVQGRPGGLARPGAPREPGAPALRGPEARPQAGALPGRPGMPRQDATRPAPGPQIARPSAGGLPPLRAPGARPQAVPLGGATTPARPNPAILDRGPGSLSRPENGQHTAPVTRPDAPGATRPAEPSHALPRGETRPELRGGDKRPQALPRVQEPSSAPRAEPARPISRPDAPRPIPRAETPRPAPRTEAPRPAPRVEAPRPTPRVEAPRPIPAPRVEAPRPAPRVEAPRPPPRMEAPRPPAPREEAPRPAPRMEAPRPAPRVEAPRPPPRMEAPRPAPAPHPAEAPGKHEPPH